MRIRAAFPLVLATVLSARLVDAQTVQQQAEAHARFEEAMTLMERRAFERACVLFEESLELAMDMTTAFRLAECYEQTRRLGPAWHYYSEVAEAAGSAGMGERQAYARKRADALAPKLARVRVEVPDEVAALDGLEITIDGRGLSASLWNRDLAVDPGHHELAAEAPEHEPWSGEIDLDAPKQPATPVVSVTVRLRKIVRPPPPEPKTEKAWVPPLSIGIALASVGAAGVVTGFVIAGVAKSHHDDSLAYCASRACTEDGLALQDQAIDEGNAATVVLSIGAVALAAGAGSLLWSYFGRDEGDARAARFDVALGAGAIALRARY